MQIYEWLHQHTADELFLHNILWSGEACSTREGVFTYHNSHFWERENSYAIRERAYQAPFSINVRAGIARNLVVGCLTGLLLNNIVNF
jgi:hypothetical protein